MKWRLLFSVLLAAAFLVLPAQSAVYYQEKLIDVTDSTTDQASASQQQISLHPMTAYWFKFDLTAISANNLRFYIMSRDPEDAGWEIWYESASISTVSELVVLVITSGSVADHDLLIGEGDVDVVILQPMPGIWRVEVKEIGGDSTSSYTVWHWRY